MKSYIKNLFPNCPSTEGKVLGAQRTYTNHGCSYGAMVNLFSILITDHDLKDLEATKQINGALAKGEVTEGVVPK